MYIIFTAMISKMFALYFLQSPFVAENYANIERSNEETIPNICCTQRTREQACLYLKNGTVV